MSHTTNYKLCQLVELSKIAAIHVNITNFLAVTADEVHKAETNLFEL